MKSSSFKWIIILLLLFTGNAYAQYGALSIEKIDQTVFKHLDDCGKDNEPALNNAESSYLNAVFADLKRPYDFSQKKVVFFTGSSGKTISSKQVYFSSEKRKVGAHTSLNGGQLLIFNETEQKQSGGYDAVIVFWSKVPPTKKRLIKLLNKQPQQAIKR